MKTQTQESAVKAPPFFVPNHGQYPQEALFAASAKHTQFYFMKSHIIHAMALAGDEADGAQGVVLSMGFVDANPGLSVQGDELYEGKVNYFIGNNAEEWKSNIPTYGELHYNEVWEGISLSIRHTEKGLKLDWRVAAGTNPAAIRLTCEGADSLSVSDDGSLVLTHRYGEVREEAPVAYQMINGRRVEVPCGYRLYGALSYGFWLGEGYDPARELIIDPLLPYATYLGGTQGDFGTGIAVDAEGCAYVTGQTNTISAVSFPVTPGAFQTVPPGIRSGFVTKFSADGSRLIYSTYLGGSGEYGWANSIAIDSAGHAYITGLTYSDYFPTTPGAFQTSATVGSVPAAYVTKFSPDGASLVYSTFLSGSGSDLGVSIRVDAEGFAYVGGGTASSDFPTTPGAFQPSLSGSGEGYDGFLAKLSADGTALIYSTYFATSPPNLAPENAPLSAVAIDAAGCLYVTGNTISAGFPVTPGAFQTTSQSDRDGFVTKFSPDGSSLVYSTFIGGSWGKGICVDEQGNAYVTGWTESADFPVTAGAAQGTYGGNTDAFVFKLSADGSAPVYSTYLGGDNGDKGYGIALASGNRACVTGQTYSSNFPTTPLVTPSALQGTSAAFLTIVSEDGTAFTVSSYIGGDNTTSGYGTAIGADGSVYITGLTTSTNFPVTPGAFQPTIAGSANVFVYRTRFALYAKVSVAITKL